MEGTECGNLQEQSQDFEAVLAYSSKVKPNSFLESLQLTEQFKNELKTKSRKKDRIGKFEIFNSEAHRLNATLVTRYIWAKL